MARVTLSLENLREDGRRPKEFRKLDVRLGVLYSADGSVMYQQGNTKVLASVHGPEELQRQGDAEHNSATITCTFAQANFALQERKTRSKHDRRSKEIELQIAQLFEAVVLRQLYPRSQISIMLQVLQEDGGLLAACVNAASLALINAGVAMRDFVVACSAGYVDATPLLDLNHNETSQDVPNLTIAVYASTGRVALTQLGAKMPMQAFDDVLELNLSGCALVYKQLKAEVRRYALGLVQDGAAVAGDEAAHAGGATAVPDEEYEEESEDSDDQDDEDGEDGHEDDTSEGEAAMDDD